MYIVPRNPQSSTTRSTVLGALGLLCCLLCMSPTACAEVRRAEEARCALSTAEPPLGALSHRSHSPSNQEANPQRKKRKIAPVDSHSASALSLWLMAFSLALPLPGKSPLTRMKKREHAFRLPSWRGFVFFAMPPPRFI